MEDVVVSGIAYDKNEAKIAIRGVPDVPGVAAKIFGALDEKHISVDLIVQNVSKDGRTDLTFTVGKSDSGSDPTAEPENHIMVEDLSVDGDRAERCPIDPWLHGPLTALAPSRASTAVRQRAPWTRPGLVNLHRSPSR